MLGTMVLSYEGTEYGTLDLVADTSVERSQLLYYKSQVEHFFQNSGVKLHPGSGADSLGRWSCCVCWYSAGPGATAPAWGRADGAITADAAAADPLPPQTL